MEVNETNRPLTETPMEQPIEAPVPTVEDTEKETSAPKQTLEEVVQRLKEINEKNDLGKLSSTKGERQKTSLRKQNRQKKNSKLS